MSSSSSSPLDSLLSPLSSEFQSSVPQPLSLPLPDDEDTDTDTDEPLASDDSRFSAISLSLDDNQDPASITPPTSASLLSEEDPTSPTVITPSAHRKSASTTTIHSAGNVPFILARVESQAHDDHDDADESDRTHTHNHRISVDGHHKLQEEFVRLQHEQQREKAESEAAIDWDFWGEVISDYTKFASEHPEKLARAIEKGIPSTLRGMMWQLMSASKDPELEGTYLALLKETSPHEKAITRDLGRTFPAHDFFTDGAGIGQENLFNVLKAYSLYDTAVGYCQGLPFVVAILLLNMPDEEAFSLLVRLMYSYDLRGHFLPEMPRLQMRLYQFDHLIEELLPVLHVHFLRQGIKSSMFCSQWFLTLFSYRFPLNIVFRIYDNCLGSGIEAIFGFSIILLQKNEDALLALKFDQLVNFLNHRLFDIYKVDPSMDDKSATYKVDEFIQDAVSLRITPFMLDSYAHEYEETVRVRDAHALEMDVLRNSNRNLSAQVKALESSLAQLNAEHVELLNELVMARLRNEETEEQLVRYKLLYAEASMQEHPGGIPSTPPPPTPPEPSTQRISIASLLGRKSR